VEDHSDLITVIDPLHPLYGRSFTLVSAAGSTGAKSQALVVYRPGILLKLPTRATDLHPAPPRLPASKLTIDGIRTLILLTRRAGFEADIHPLRHDCLKHDSEPDFAKSHGSPEGEP
jgi:hypothetical protein